MDPAVWVIANRISRAFGFTKNLPQPPQISLDREGGRQTIFPFQRQAAQLPGAIVPFQLLKDLLCPLDKLGQGTDPRQKADMGQRSSHGWRGQQFGIVRAVRTQYVKVVDQDLAE